MKHEQKALQTKHVFLIPADSFCLLQTTISIVHHHALRTEISPLPNLLFNNKMKYLSLSLLFAIPISLTQAQRSDDACITCYLGDLFKGFEYGLKYLVIPAVPILPSNPDATDPTQGYVEPQTNLGEQRSTNNLPGSNSQSDLEFQVIGEPDPECDPNGAGVSSLLPIH